MFCLGSFPAVVLYDKNNLRVLLYFAKDHASPIRTDTLVTVVTFISNNMKSLRNISLQVSVPKVCIYFNSLAELSFLIQTLTNWNSRLGFDSLSVDKPKTIKIVIRSFRA